MNNLITKIFWNLNNYCKAECTYCPSRFRNGPEPKHISEYKNVASKLINNYSFMGRTIHWWFDGGEPLDMFDFPEFLKLCKTSNGNIDLITNGGRLWLDWWAIEPYVDSLHLTYHYWQNPNLIRYIIQIFKEKNKFIEVSVPIRPLEKFSLDWNRAEEMEKLCEISINKIPLTKDRAGEMHGYFDYSLDQFEKLFGKEWVEQTFNKKPQTFAETFQERIDTNPSFTGRLCNVGIEKLNISHDGWVSGSNCNNLHLGNIWDESFLIPNGPSKCKMISCIHGDDQQITKF